MSLVEVCLIMGSVSQTYERAFEPLGGVGVQSILGEVLKVSSEGAQTLGPHGVTLVSLHRPTTLVFPVALIGSLNFSLTIALLPIWSFSKGSSTSFSMAK